MNDATIYIKRIGFDFQRAFGFRQKATEKEKKTARAHQSHVMQCNGVKSIKNSFCSVQKLTGWHT